MDSSLYDPIRTMSRVTREVIVAFSGGKDSIVTLDLCMKFFDRVEVFFMYQVPGISFQERTMRLYERKYGISILRLPHFETSEFLRYGTYRIPDPTVPIISVTDVYDWIRGKTGIYWIAAGERAADSIVRGAMIKHSGSIDTKRGRFYPVAWWRKPDIMNYMRIKNLHLGADSKALGHSFRDISGATIKLLRDKYPLDYERVKRIYPLCDAAIRKEEVYGDNPI